MKRTRLRPISPKRSKALREYSVRRREFLAKFPGCQLITLKWLAFPNGEPCDDVVCPNASRDVHHVRGRGLYLNDESTWMAVCRECHDWIHQNPSKARAWGVLK